MQAPITGGMPDTMEYFSMFHMSLKLEGPEEMLIMMVLTVLAFLMMFAQYDKVIKLIDATNAEWAK